MAKRKRKAKTSASRRKAKLLAALSDSEESDFDLVNDEDDDFSLDDESVNDGSDEEIWGDSSRRRSTRSKKMESSSSSSEEDDDDEIGFDDGYASDLMGDENDRVTLQAMSQIEREQTLYVRAQARDRIRERQQAAREHRRKEKIQKMKKRGKKKKKSKTATTRKQKADSAFSDLKARRQRRLARTSSQADVDNSESPHLSDRDFVVEDVIDEEDEMRMQQQHQYHHKRFQEKLVDERPLTIGSLRCIQARRDYVERYCDEPYFSIVMTGLFVRYLTRKDEYGESKYRCMEVLGVNDGKKTYKLGNKLTRVMLTLGYGKARRDFRMDMISNSSITESEMNRYLETCKRDQYPLLTHAKALDRKRNAEATKKEFKYTPDVVEKMLRKKQEVLGPKTGNLARRQLLLHQLREQAGEANDQQAFEKYNEQLDEVQDYQNQLKRHRDALSVGDFGATSINTKKRRQNIVTADSFGAPSRSISGNVVDTNPFARKSTRPGAIWKPSHLQQSKPAPVVLSSSSSSRTDEKEQPTVISHSKAQDPSARSSPSKQTTIENAITFEPTSSSDPSFTELQKSWKELVDSHAFDLSIDLKKVCDRPQTYTFISTNHGSIADSGSVNWYVPPSTLQSSIALDEYLK